MQTKIRYFIDTLLLSVVESCYRRLLHFVLFGFYSGYYWLFVWMFLLFDVIYLVFLGLFLLFINCVFLIIFHF